MSSKSSNSKINSLKNKFTKRKYQIIIAIILLLIIGLLSLYLLILRELPSPRNLANSPFAVSTKIYDRNDKLLYEIFADQNRTPISLDQLPPYVKQATIAIEDRDFYKHQGFALSGIGRAIINNTLYIFCQLPLTDCQINLQGGSTITQQLVKNALLTPEQTLQRKLRELVLTFFVELLYSKDQILEMYLNQIPYGGTSYGLEAASQTYFGIKAQDLTLAQSAILAGLPVAPTRYSPFGSNPEKYKERQQAVLRRMVEDNYITQDQSQAALDEPVTFANPANLIHAPHFVLWVKELLVDQYGSKKVETGGLRVKTSLDLDLQDITQASLSAEINTLQKSNVTNGAALITNPLTGEILTMIGSTDYYNNQISGKFNVPLSYRQPGSSIKPLNYTQAFYQHNLSPGSIISDLPTCFQEPPLPSYCPQNYDGSFHGAVSIRRALANSYNIPAVKLLALNGVTHFIDFSHKMGITGWDDPSRYGLSLTLGGGEVRMIDMAVAYGTLSNLGVKVPLHPILEISDYQNQTLYQLNCQPANIESLVKDNSESQFSSGCQATRVIPPGPPYLTTHILTDQNARASTFGSTLNIPGRPDVAVKTGTTNQLHDNWTIGYTHTRLTAVWVGNNDNSAMSRIASGITGAAPIWRSLMKQALIDQPRVQLNPPEGILGTQICSLTGMLPVDNCPTTFDLFPKEGLPTSANQITRQWPIDTTTQSPSKTNTPPEQVQMMDKQIVFDILGSPICIDCELKDQSQYIKYPILTPTPIEKNIFN